MDDSNTEYFRLRERQELARAASSANSSVAGIHQELAGRYAALGRQRDVISAYFEIGDDQSPLLMKCEVEPSP